MAFQRPTLTQIVERIENDVKAALGITTILRRSFLKAFSRALGGAAHQLHGHLVFISRQIFPDQAEAEYLDRWGSIYGLERKSSTFTQLSLEVITTGAAVLSIGSIYKRTDGTEYATTAELNESVSGTYYVTVEASVSGSDSNMDDGQVLSLESPVANVQTDATVDSTIIEGDDRELDADYRTRVVQRIQQPPAGGTAEDYKAFALSVAGVTRAWVFPSYLGEGTVGVSFVEDNESPIIPSAPKVAEVQLAVDTQKPVTANAVVFAPIDNPVDLDIALSPNTEAVRNAVTAELTDLFQREGEVRGALKGISSFETGIIPLSRINEAISIAAGENDHTILNTTGDPQPETNGGILTLGTLTYSTLV